MMLLWAIGNMVQIGKLNLTLILTLTLTDSPPTSHFVTLPGTDRKPIKPWQLCSEEEKALELFVACTLDWYVLGLALGSGLGVGVRVRMRVRTLGSKDLGSGLGVGVRVRMRVRTLGSKDYPNPNLILTTIPQYRLPSPTSRDGHPYP
jgi:hypothetical protein